LLSGKIFQMRKPVPDLVVIGGGLAGSEAAWQAAQAGLLVHLYEMRPNRSTGAHVSDCLAEIVCSNSFGSRVLNRPSGLLKEELHLLGSKLLEIAEACSVPAGDALAVDREAFGRLVTETIQNHPKIRVIREEKTEIPGIPTIIASGPLTSPLLSAEIGRLSGLSHLFFYDAIAPIIAYDSIDLEIAYRGSRYGHSESDNGDYINCPMTRDEYEIFIDALLSAERIELKEFERDIETGVRSGFQAFFEGCLPIEIMAQRGRNSLAFGPMRPVGLLDPRTGKRPYAVVQLRQDNLSGSLYNVVGFQTNLTYPEQKRVFRLIPGLENAIFERFGQMHRNTFIFSPDLLAPTLQFRSRPDLFFAGQITGVEGYMGNIATGTLAGLNAAALIQGNKLFQLPGTTMLGALCHYITHASAKDFQPMKANYGLLPPLENLLHKKIGRREKNQLLSERALSDLKKYLDMTGEN
jgi:methylenetetrahydrofolate--tRNA-(uracil-5-)-methyltransferase